MKYLSLDVIDINIQVNQHEGLINKQFSVYHLAIFFSIMFKKNGLFLTLYTSTLYNKHFFYIGVTTLDLLNNLGVDKV